MTTPKQSMLVIIGGNSSFHYLIGRFTERVGYSMEVLPASVAAGTVCRLLPLAVIFSSVETLEASQVLVAGLANCDIPIIVCSSATDQLRTSQLGADYCLLHPLVYANFSDTLTSVSTLQGIDRPADAG